MEYNLIWQLSGHSSRVVHRENYFKTLYHVITVAKYAAGFIVEVFPLPKCCNEMKEQHLVRVPDAAGSGDEATEAVRMSAQLRPPFRSTSSRPGLSRKSRN